MASDIKIECDEIMSDLLDEINQCLYSLLDNKLDLVYKLYQNFSDFENIEKIINEQSKYYMDEYFPNLLDQLEDSISQLEDELSDCEHHLTKGYIEDCIEQFDDLKVTLEYCYNNNVTEYTDFKLFISDILKKCVSELPNSFKYYETNVYDIRMLYFKLNMDPNKNKNIISLLNSYFISKI